MILALLVCLAIAVAWLIIELISDRHSYLPSPPPVTSTAYPVYGRRQPTEPTPAPALIAVERPAARPQPALARLATLDERTAALRRRLEALERRTADDKRKLAQLQRRTRSVHAAAYDAATKVAVTLAQPTPTARPLLLAAS